MDHMEHQCGGYNQMGRQFLREYSGIDRAERSPGPGHAFDSSFVSSFSDLSSQRPWITPGSPAGWKEKDLGQIKDELSGAWTGLFRRRQRLAGTARTVGRRQQRGRAGTRCGRRLRSQPAHQYAAAQGGYRGHHHCRCRVGARARRRSLHDLPDHSRSGRLLKACRPPPGGRLTIMQAL